MKRILLIIALSVCALLSNAQSSKKVLPKQPVKKNTVSKKPVKKTAAGTKALTVSKVLLPIKKVTIKDVRAIMDTTSGPLIVNFWATWCGPCIREIPYFDSLIAVKGKPVKLLLVSLDFPEDYPWHLAQFVKKQGYKGEVVFLNEKNADYFCPVIDPKWMGAIPASMFVNNSKKSREFFGFQLTRERFALELDKLVD